jgi:hypothetical protein
MVPTLDNILRFGSGTARRRRARGVMGPGKLLVVTGPGSAQAPGPVFGGAKPYAALAVLIGPSRAQALSCGCCSCKGYLPLHTNSVRGEMRPRPCKTGGSGNSFAIFSDIST